MIEIMQTAPLIIGLTLISLMQTTSTDANAPVAPRVEHQEVRHGETVTDNYFWLRQKSNPDVVRYLEAENAYTAEMTKGLQPFADSLYKEMLSHIKQTDLGVPVKRGDYLYYSRTEEGKQYPINCRRKGNMASPEEVILDLNQIAQGKKFVGLGESVVSDDQNLLAYTLDFTGFRQYTLQVKDLRTGQTLSDKVERVTSLEWAADNKTLLLTTEDNVTKRPDTLWRHTLAGKTEQVYHEPDELYDLGLMRTRDRKYIVLEIESKDTNECRYISSAEPAKEPQVFLPREKKHRYYLEHREGLFYVRTNHDAQDKEVKDFELVTTPEGEVARSHWKTFVPHTPGVLLESVDLFRDFAVVDTLTEAVNHLRVYNFGTKQWHEISFAEPVYAASPGSTPEFNSATFRYNYQSFITPPSVFDFHVNENRSELLKRQEVPGGYDPSNYVSERLWATARDGIKVPISIVYKKGLVRDGKAPLFLYAYGSYGISTSASFNSSRLALLDRGMSYAIAHIRGGSEMGENWREDGMLMKKKNTFQDFIDSAEYLIKEKWTSSERLVIEGGSAGGLLMGAVTNMRPDLFKAVHTAVPFVDVMNTMLDASLPLTVGEYLEWGNPNEKAAYDYMKSYSPYDNLEKRAYPAILVTTSFNDSQVMYWEPAKYVARLRTLKADSTPLLLKIKMDPAGHGGASGRYDRLKDTAFEYAWMLSQVGIQK
jgi:oligopeptidase B